MGVEQNNMGNASDCVAIDRLLPLRIVDIEQDEAHGISIFLLARFHGNSHFLANGTPVGVELQEDGAIAGDRFFVAVRLPGRGLQRYQTLERRGCRGIYFRTSQPEKTGDREEGDRKNDEFSSKSSLHFELVFLACIFLGRSFLLGFYW